jgi:hypothetical protein
MLNQSEKNPSWAKVKVDDRKTNAARRTKLIARISPPMYPYGVKEAKCISDMFIMSNTTQFSDSRAKWWRHTNEVAGSGATSKGYARDPSPRWKTQGFLDDGTYSAS